MHAHTFCSEFTNGTPLRTFDICCRSAGCWTREEATNIYHRKLELLLSLYRGQLLRLKHVFKERRRAFLIQWQREGGSKLQGVGFHLLTMVLIVQSGIDVWFR